MLRYQAPALVPFKERVQARRLGASLPTLPMRFTRCALVVQLLKVAALHTIVFAQLNPPPSRFRSPIFGARFDKFRVPFARAHGARRPL